MNLFFVHTLESFLPLALFFGLVAAQLQIPERRRKLASLGWAALAGLGCGWVAYSLAAEQQQFTLVRSALRALLILSAPTAFVCTLLAPSRRAVLRAVAVAGACVFLVAIAAQGLFALRDRIYYEGLSATFVLNTELILNLGGIASGLLMAAVLTALLLHMGRLCGRRISGALLLLAIAVLEVLWGAEALLGMMRLGWVELTSARLSFVAVITDYSSQLSYPLLALIALLALCFLHRAMALFQVRTGRELPAQRRKELSLRLTEQRRFKSAVAALVLIVASLLYHDLYASRPPRISEPTIVRPGADGMLRFRIVDFTGGDLHRFAYVMQDGKVIRFFLMNRFSDQIKIGVALDACLLCGDMGYIQEGDNLICLACNVSIFVPSLGKAGGCNPIPLAHRTEGDDIVIAAADLEAGARYFNEVKEIEVADPVTGETVINTEASYQYEYRGRTYFFASEESWRQFRAAPEKYRPAAKASCPPGSPCATGGGEGHGNHGGHAGHGEG